MKPYSADCHVIWLMPGITGRNRMIWWKSYPTFGSSGKFILEQAAVPRTAMEGKGVSQLSTGQNRIFLWLFTALSSFVLLNLVTAVIVQTGTQKLKALQASAVKLGISGQLFEPFRICRNPRQAMDMSKGDEKEST